MPAPTAVPPAAVRTRTVGQRMIVELDGTWRITAEHPSWQPSELDPDIRVVELVPGNLGAWDSSLVLFVHQVCRWTRGAQRSCEMSALPAAVTDLVEQLEQAPTATPAAERGGGFVTSVGLAATGLWRRVRELTQFVGECVISIVRLIKQPGKFRWRDCLHEMQQCGAMALPISGLIAFLVGVTLAYTGAIILRQFGGDIWVADLIGLSMTREMGAVMTGIVLAGRTGAAFAAEIGNMKAGEELDALETLGIRAVDFLVIPRIVALVLMMPLLTLYANALGIIGGMVIALVLLDIPPTAYWVEMLTIVDMSDLMTGLIKAFTFGAIVALSGCLRGLQADRSAVGVGRAATSAVVTSILLIVVADALFAVIFNILGW